VLLARAAGEPFADVLRTRIFDPLAMAATGFWTPQTQRLATAYRPTSDALVAWDQPNGTWSHPPASGDRAAGLVPAADDLLVFARMLARAGSLVLPAHAMASEELTPAQKAHGGLGPDFFKGRSWGLGQSVLEGGAYGWVGGFGTSWLVEPTCDLTIIVATQLMFERAEPPQVHRDIQAAAQAALS
jgi:CubicO group peptidase (beta-lactamase class C family)